MTAKITFLFSVLYSVVTFGQNFLPKNDAKLYDLLQNKTETKILYDRVTGISRLTDTPKEWATSAYFKQVYHEIQRADFLNRLPKLEIVTNEAALGLVQKQVPISILIADFESINKDALNTKEVFLNNQNQYEAKNNRSVFDTHKLSLIAPLVSKTKSKSIEFVLNKNLIFNTSKRIIASVSANFNEGSGWKMIGLSTPIRINFNTEGNQIIDFEIVFTNGEIVHQKAAFEIDQNYKAITTRNSLDANAITSITASIPYQGYEETSAFLGQGEYDIYLDNVNGVLDKPIFVMDAFDPGDTRDIPSIYSLLSYGTTGQNLADNLRAQGYDIVILNFPNYTRPNSTTVIDGGVDYIQRNAMVLIELINQINSQKVGSEKNIIIGPSASGLIARFGLRYMETHNMNPDTRLYISFDTPHLGANFPIGMQHLFNYMANGPLGDTSVLPIVDGILKSPAGREMLIDQFEGHLQSGSTFEFNTSVVLPTGKPSFRNAFQSELNAIGFPTSTRNIAIANGSGNGSMTGTPNMVLMDHTFNTTTTQRAIINLRFAPLTNQSNQVSRFRAQALIFGFWISAYESLANSKAPTFTSGLDSAPGGKFDMSTFAPTPGTNPLLTEFFDNLALTYFDFIPTNSALAVSNTTNLYTPISGTTVTPFQATSVPIVNENHITLNAENVAFVMNEILNPLMTTAENSPVSNISIKNPIGNNIEIFSAVPLQNSEITITDSTGKLIIIRQNQTVVGNYQIPVEIVPGLYFLTIKNDMIKECKKLIKN